MFFKKSQTLGKVVSWGKFKSSTEKEKNQNISHLFEH